nr:general odorant-binding protein 1-like isoform X2 [Plodia interpunctella]
MWRGFYPRSLKMSRVLFFFFAMLLVGVSKTDASQETLKHITSGFLRTLDQCKHELQLPDHIVSDLYHYWREDYSLLNRDTGCAILCMSKKLDMVDSEGKLHHGNTREFAEKHGAGGFGGTSSVIITSTYYKTSFRRSLQTSVSSTRMREAVRKY